MFEFVLSTMGKPVTWLRHHRWCAREQIIDENDNFLLSVVVCHSHKEFCITGQVFKNENESRIKI